MAEVSKPLVTTMVVLVFVALIAGTASLINRSTEEDAAVVGDIVVATPVVIGATGSGTEIATEVAITSATPAATATTAVTSTATPVATTVAASTTYKDGSYTAAGNYSTPEGVENISITLTVKDDVITAASGSNTAIDRESKEYQTDFLANFPSLVVGKKLSDVSLSSMGRTSGGSLTPRGFNAAVASIKTKAS